MKASSYRPEIDGLRAVAVLGVLFFHAGCGFPGGYVGVDVFFVISGFLITGIILKELREGRFSFENFWIRRIRRILPASVVLLLAVLVCGWWLMEPRSYRSTAEVAATQAFFSSNFYFARGIDYFSEAIELHPLLHMWSLAVEEQFYFILPFVLVFMFRFGRKHIALSLVIAAILSFVLSCITLGPHPSKTFFLLPTRAWELLAGSLLAIFSARIKPSAVIAEAGSVLGLLAIFIPMMLYTKLTLFPAYAAVPPVLGAVLIIACNTHGKTVVGRLLSLPPFIGVGLISYSLYLWHWPIFAFSKHLFVEVRAPLNLSLITLSFALAWLSWKYIEQPFRGKSILKTKAALYGSAVVASVTIGVFALTIRAYDGLPDRLDPAEKALASDIYWNGSKYLSGRDGKVAIGALNEESDANPDFVLWGDSHGMVVAKLVDQLAKERNLKGVALLSSGIPPVINTWKPAKTGPDGDRIETIRINQERMNWILESGVKHVFIVSRWNGMLNGSSDFEVKERPELGRSYPLITDDADAPISNAVASAALERQLGRMIQTFTERGIHVYILKNPPEAGSSKVARLYFTMRKFPWWNDFPASGSSIEDYRQRRVETEEVFSRLAGPGVSFLDPLDFFFKDRDHVLRYTDRALFRDDNHLSREGVVIYLKSLIESVLNSVAGVKVDTVNN